RLGVDEHHVGVAAAAGVERLAGALGDHAHVDAGLLFEDRQEVLEEPRLLGGGGGGHRDELVLRQHRGGAKQQADQNARRHAHGNSPLRNASASGEAGFEKNRSTGLRSAIRPWWMKSTSSPRRRAWPRLCVLMMILVPAASNARMTDSISRVAPGSRL